MLGRMASQAQGQLSVFRVQLNKDVGTKIPIQPLRRVDRKNQSEETPRLAKDPSKLLSNFPSKRTRRGTLKSKTGCKTCKSVIRMSLTQSRLTRSRIRHTKCDESHPRCNKCTETGRQCDYTDVFLATSGSPPVPPPRRSSLQASRTRRHAAIDHPTGHTRPTAPLPAFRISETDGHYFQYICILSTNGFADVFDNALWLLVLQMSQFEPCIRHVALGLAMLHQIYGFIVRNPNDPSYLDTYYSGIKHYSKAVNALKDRLANVNGNADTTTWEVSLFASYLFTGFEVIVGNELGAYWQVCHDTPALIVWFTSHNTSPSLSVVSRNGSANNVDRCTAASSLWRMSSPNATRNQLLFHCQEIWVPWHLRGTGSTFKLLRSRCGMRRKLCLHQVFPTLSLRWLMQRM